LLVIGMVTLGIVWATGGFEPKAPPTVESNDDGDRTPSTNQKPSTPSASTIKQKTAITLPSTTKVGNYSYSPAGAATITDSDGIESTWAALINVTEGKAVATKKGSEKVYPASMTKVMTLLVACENAKDPTALLTVTQAMETKYKSSYNPGESCPSVATSWKVGNQVTVEDALHLVIYESDTYACWLLAEHIAGSEEAFVQMMNQKASAMGLSGTHFENSTGLYDSNHYTTCLDMAAIMAAAMNNAAAKKVLTAKDQYFVDVYANGIKQGSFGMWSGWYTGRLEAYPYVSPTTGKKAIQYVGGGSDIKFVAGKTGYEDIPKCCFVTAGEHDGPNKTLYVCVQVGASTAKISTDDVREIYQKYAKD